MLKKVVVGTLLAGLVGILVFGAVKRTVDRTGKVAEAAGLGYGTGRASDEAQGRGGNGQGGARGGATERQYPNNETAPETWMVYEGTVVQAPEDGVELGIETSEGEQLQVGTGPLDLAVQGFALQVGEHVQVRGYWEAGEFKAAEITRLANGQTLTLRDASGRPAWAGSGRDARQGGREEAPGDRTGTGQAQLDGWLQFQGTVVSVDEDVLVVRASDGEQIKVENRAWWFAQEQGFSAQIEDQVTLTGFYEGEDFEVGRIDDATNGQTVLVRDENGRPLWAGRGRRGA